MRTALQEGGQRTTLPNAKGQTGHRNSHQLPNARVIWPLGEYVTWHLEMTDKG